jgi:hypothetical protein
MFDYEILKLLKAINNYKNSKYKQQKRNDIILNKKLSQKI